MLTHRQVATLQAALLYWQDEMCPHGALAMRAYYDLPDVEPLSAAEVARLREQLSSGLRYAIYDVRQEQLHSQVLYADLGEVESAAGGLNVATVLLSLTE